MVFVNGSGGENEVLLKKMYWDLMYSCGGKLNLKFESHLIFLEDYILEKMCNLVYK